MSDASRKAEILQPNSDVVAKRLGDAAILVDVPTNRIFELNETGTRVWELLDQGLDRGRIVHHLVDEFEVDEERAIAEVEDLISRLRTEGLLV